MNTSSPHVPAHLVHTPAREASDPPEETLHWEGNPDQCPTVSAALQKELKVSGESNIFSHTVYPQHHEKLLRRISFGFIILKVFIRAVTIKQTTNSATVLEHITVGYLRTV